MALHKGFDHIAFSRLQDLVKFPLPRGQLNEITYVANATNFRRCLLNKFGDDNIDIDHEIATNTDTRLTYCGYKRFLESDLKHIFPRGKGRTSNGYKRDVKFLAKEMLIRGHVSSPALCCRRVLMKPRKQAADQWITDQAFAGAAKAAFPKHLRLSIHQSTGEHKISMSLLNTKTGFTTPWHCSVALMADGEWVSAPMGDFKGDSRMEVVEVDGRPSHFREKEEPEQT